MLPNALDLAPGGFALPAIQLHCGRAGQPPLRPIHNRGHRLQIAQQFGICPGRGFLLRLSLRFEEQTGVVQNAFANRGRTFAPGRIELAGCARVAVMQDEDLGHPLTVVRTLARHRHQKLHGRLRWNLPLAHLLLDRFRQSLYQRQPSRHPAHAAIEAAGQFIEPVAEPLLQFRQQPAHLQRRLLFR